MFKIKCVKPESPETKCIGPKLFDVKCIYPTCVSSKLCKFICKTNSTYSIYLAGLVVVVSGQLRTLSIFFFSDRSPKP